MGLVLARALARVFEQYDYALLDCSPMLGVLMVNALGACEQLIIPVQTEYLAVQGLERMLHTLMMITRARKTPLKYCIVPTMYDRRTHVSKETLATMQQKYAASLWDGVIPIDSQLRQAAQDGTPLSTHHRSARSVQAYDRLLDHLLGLPVAEAPPLPAANHA
jgi:chromosome partitioning protein